MNRTQELTTRIKQLATAAFVAAVTLLMCELGARAALAYLGPIAAPIQVSEDEGGANQRLADELYQFDPQTFFSLRPDLVLDQTSNPRIFDVRINSLGMRGPDVRRDKQDGCLRILCIGDSCTFGSGAATDQTWPAWLGKRFANDRGDLTVEVLNAGVPGYTSFQGRAYLRANGFSLHPDYVVVALGFNDTSKSKPGPGRRFESSVALTDSEYAKESSQASRFALPRLAQRWHWKSRPQQPDSGSDYRPRVPLTEYRQNLIDIAEETRAAGAQPVFVVWPVVGQAGGPHLLDREQNVRAYQQCMRTVAVQLQVRLVDLVPAVAGQSALFVDGVHLNSAGYRLVAAKVFEALAL